MLGLIYEALLSLFLVVYRTTKLTKEEIKRISTVYELHWDELAGLMNIPYKEREKIRLQLVDPSLKAAKVCQLLNSTDDFDRHALERCMDELQLKNDLPAFEGKVCTGSSILLSCKISVECQSVLGTVKMILIISIHKHFNCLFILKHKHENHVSRTKVKNDLATVFTFCSKLLILLRRVEIWGV